MRQRLVADGSTAFGAVSEEKITVYDTRQISQPAVVTTVVRTSRSQPFVRRRPAYDNPISRGTFSSNNVQCEPRTACGRLSVTDSFSRRSVFVRVYFHAVFEKLRLFTSFY